MKHLPLLLLLLAACAAVFAAQPGQPAPTLDMLLKDLAGDNGPVQARARQLLPRHGTAALPGLVALLGDERDHVWRTAAMVIKDVSQQPAAVVMGGETPAPARRAVLDALLPCIAPDRPKPLIERALAILPLVVDEETDIAPVAALLDNADLRDRAKAALQEAGTSKALHAIAGAAAQTANADFQCALLAALFDKQPKLGADAWFAAKLLESPWPKVRAAAARILAETGRPEFWPMVLASARVTDATAQFEAWDACLRYADAAARAGGRWEEAMARYRTVLAEAPDTVLKGGAIAGLGRFGDDSVIPELAAILKDPNASQTASPALGALCSLQGRAANLGLLDVWASLPPDAGAALLLNFGTRRDSVLTPLLVEQAQSADPSMRAAALEGLVRSGAPEAAPVLAKALLDAPGAERPPLEDQVRRLANDLRDHNQPEAAGRAYLALYRTTADPDLKAAALEGVRRYPVPEAFDIVMGMLASGDAESMPVAGMIGVAMAAMDAGKKEEGQKILDTLMTKMGDPATARQVIEALGRMPDPGRYAGQLGAIQKWRVVGPFDWTPADGFAKTFINEPNVDLSATYDKGQQWKPLETGHLAGHLDLTGPLEMRDNAAAFAHCVISVSEDMDATLRGGSDDGLKIWVNGEVVHENDVDRGYAPDSDVAPVKLKAGKNAVLVMISQRMGGWNFGLRLTRPDGTVPAFTVE